MNIMPRRKNGGMALPMALIVLLVGGALVAVSMYLVENMTEVNRMKVEDEMRMNAAIAGVEACKSWLLSHSDLPKRLNYGNKLITGDVSELLVYSSTMTINDVQVDAVVYDVIDDVGPMSSDVPLLEKYRLVRTTDSQYDHSSGGNTSTQEMGAYVIRCTASLNGIQKAVEQGLTIVTEILLR